MVPPPGTAVPPVGVIGVPPVGIVGGVAPVVPISTTGIATPPVMMLMSNAPGMLDGSLDVHPVYKHYSFSMSY